MYVCPFCFGAEGLGRRIKEIRPAHAWNACDFHSSKKGVPIGAVAGIIDPVFRAHYARVPDDGLGNSRGDELWSTISDLVGSDNERIIEQIKDCLIDSDQYWPPNGEEAYYSDDYGYVSDDFAFDEHGRLWHGFRQRLMHEARFFNEEMEKPLRRIFEGIQLQRTADRQGPVYFIKPGESTGRFFRARLADDEVAQRILDNPVLELGPPPEHLRRPGRMNPSGIAVFYAGFDLDTCISELRPLVGSSVIVGEFEITEPMLVLDTTRFERPPKAHDPFAKNAIQRAAQWRFMRTFMLQIAQPVSPNDAHLDYVPTQVVAEYLARRHEFGFGGERKGFDAIIYRSAQNPEGRNIALFGDAARLVHSSPPVRSRSEPSLDHFWSDFEGLEFSEAQRPGRLRIVPESVRTCRVASARFTVQEQPAAGSEDD